MEGRKIVLKETAIICLGEAIGTALMLGVFALLGTWDISVLLGGIAGSLLAIGNFFMMAIVSSLAADRAKQGDVAGGQKLIKGSYPIRMLVLGVLLILLAKSGVCNIIALVIPLVFVQPTLLIAEFFRKKEA